MRPEITEYNFDWMLERSLHSAAKLGDGSLKERETMFRYLPYFKRPLGALFQEPEAASVFLKMMSMYFNNIITAREKDKKIAATTFCFSPTILYAMGAVPVTFEILSALAGLIWKRGGFDYLDYGCEIGLTETSCSSQRGAFGAYLAGLAEEIDFIVCDTPGVCDTNANAFAFAGAYLEKPFYQLNYPQQFDQRTDRYHVEDYQELVDFLEEQTGTALDYDRLAEILREVEKQDALTAQLEDMMMQVPCPMPPLYNLFIYGGRFTCAGLPEYTRTLETMVAVTKENMRQGRSGLISGVEKRRVYMCYIDHYTVDLNFWSWLDEKGLAHLGGILSKNFQDSAPYAGAVDGSTYTLNLESPDSMLDSIAQLNARLPMVRSIRGPYDRPNMWLEESLAIAKLYKADCVIYNGTPGCRNTWGMVKPFARDMEKHGFPTHIMYDDAFDDRVESWEATRERLEEFFKIRGLL